MNKFSCSNGTKLVRLTCCGKLMHKNCMRKWCDTVKHSQLKCPMCNTNIKTEQTRRNINHVVGQFRLIQMNNTLPVIHSTDDGTWRRLRITS